jgi:hypothetical protein
MAGFSPGYKRDINGWTVEIQDHQHIRLTHEQEVHLVTEQDGLIVFGEANTVPILVKEVAKSILGRMRGSGSGGAARDLQDGGA